MFIVFVATLRRERVDVGIVTVHFVHVGHEWYIGTADKRTPRMLTRVCNSIGLDARVDNRPNSRTQDYDGYEYHVSNVCLHGSRAKIY